MNMVENVHNKQVVQQEAKKELTNQKYVDNLNHINR